MSFAQPIIINKDGTHEDAITAVTLASYSAFLIKDTDNLSSENWDKWLAGHFTKSVRRANDKLFKQLAGFHPSPVLLAIGSSMALAFPPMEQPFPKQISRSQVADTELPRKGWHAPPTTGFVLAINPDLEMTTGKTAAQCAHAYFGFHLRYPSSPRALRITDSAEIFEKLLNSEKEKVQINDAGFTEVEPGSLTVIAGIL